MMKCNESITTAPLRKSTKPHFKCIHFDSWQVPSELEFNKQKQNKVNNVTFPSNKEHREKWINLEGVKINQKHSLLSVCVCVGGGREKFHLIKFFGGQQQKERNAQLMAGMSLEWPYK